jgi:alginate O-acetyltransferase complex protein AlgI
MCYFIIPEKYIKWRNLVLFLFSLVFYAWGEPVYICLMLFSTVFDYINGLLIEKFGVKTKGAKIVLIVSLLGNLGLLGVFKYTDFILGNINNLLGTSIPLLELALPIGISFYTFQTLSYTIDVYRGVVPAQHNIISFGAYVAMFPQLIAGPIVQFKTVAEELNHRVHNWGNFYIGVRRFCIGFTKKVFLANNIGFVWSEILSNYANSSVLTLWLGLICFAFQIYFDFSGYSDMAIGLGRMLGFHYLENFNYPYVSKSITEFWRRWHISLGSWFRDYVYIPLGGNQKGFKRQIVNLSIVWLLTGIWHGASWNYVLWGIYYGILIIIEKLFLLKWLEKYNISSHIYTLFLVLIGWGIFAIEDFSILTNYMSCLFGLGGLNVIDNQFIYYLQNYGVLLIICAIASVNYFSQGYSILKAQRPWVKSLENIFIIVVFVMSLAMLVNSTYNPFLYFRF